jgi:proteic killer suppression protein
MLKTIADKRTRRFLDGETVKEFEAFARQLWRRLQVLADASCIEDLMLMRSNRFEALKGDRLGQYSIRVNDQWRICFRFEEGDAFDVEVTDYH